jgi:tetratricopeptide (TPR) repeat protein
MGVQAVVLSACESSKASSDSLNNGLTRRISAQGIPHVIGMRESILDRAGIQFARALCDELARRERIDTALQTARIAIQAPLKDGWAGESGLGAAEELSLGQWCLPILLSSDPQDPLIDWDFRPQEVEARILNRRLDSVTLPARFVGRRAEMRRYKSRALKGEIRYMLITGPGGQGKTSLAGKLALDLQRQGYRVFAWSARPENPWRRFVRDLSLSLEGNFAQTYDRGLPGFENEREHAETLLGLLTEQYRGRVVCFLDNLETIQDPDTLEINDGTVAVWLDAARNTQGVILLATSRWQLPGWDGEHLTLSRANYGDFLQMAQQLAARGQLRRSLLEKRLRLRHVYGVLGGNSRGLELFAAATLDMESPEEEALLQRLAATKRDLQANMAIEAIYARLPEIAKTLLARLPAYYEPVPAEGMIKLGIDLPEDPQPLLDRLLAVSLLEAQSEADWDVIQYQCGSLVTDWLRQQNLIDEQPGWLNAAADYHLYLLKYERRSLRQSIITHGALRRAGRHAEADRLTLDAIVGPLTRGGFYATLLKEWLPRICDSLDPKTRGEALGQTGKLLFRVGDYVKALSYLKQSLAISQQIGDKAGEGTALNNISQVFKAQGDYETALSYLKQSLAIRQQIGDKAGEGTTLNNISQIYDARGDYETALSYLKQSLAIWQQIGDKSGEGTTLNNISQIYDARGDYETALSYLKQSLAIWQQIGDKAGEGTTLNNISAIYHARGDYETALSYLKQSLAIWQQIGDKAGEGTTLNNISQVFKARGDYETALSYLKQSLAIRQQIGDKAGLCATLFNMGHIHIQNGQTQEAVAAWVTVYMIAKPMNLAEVLQALANLAPQLGLPAGLEGWERLAEQFQIGAQESNN